MLRQMTFPPCCTTSAPFDGVLAFALLAEMAIGVGHRDQMAGVG